MDYLTLHLREEEELPSQYDPRGRNFNVVLPTVSEEGRREGGREKEREGGRKSTYRYYK